MTENTPLNEALVDKMLEHSQRHQEILTRLDEHQNHSHCIFCERKQHCDRIVELNTRLNDNARDGAKVMMEMLPQLLKDKPIPGPVQ